MTRLSIVILALAAAACQSSQSSPSSSAPRQAASNITTCDGEPYLDVNNNTGAPVDIYAYLGTAAGTFIASASTGFSRVSLVGTRAERANGSFYAMQNGRSVTNAGVPNSTVSITRRCDRAAAKPPEH
ncbi:MAG TPA: hypothetical protein VN706_09405 [Gemmatimonadaceae bacterium]|nr:hypothetical protein [Gemmatimonadaceae bacterium]